MKEKTRRLLSLLLVLSVLMGLGAAPVWAADETPVTGSGSICNPLYPQIAQEESPAAEAAVQAPQLEASASAVYVSPEKAAEQMRDAMAARKTEFTLYIYSTSGTPDIKNVILPMACSEELATGVNTGDYLQWSWIQGSWSWIDYRNGKYDFVVDMEYYTTAAQEQWFLSELDQLMDNLDLWEKSDYFKYCGIYDYIADYVDYDTAALSRVEAGTATSEDYLIYSAYDALKNGKAVCQGYACLFYAMCRSMGLPVRVIAGTAQGGNHAWNIVELQDLWYNLDVTWDGQDDVSYRNFFLLGSENFTGHYPGSNYTTSAFQAAYPISRTDYVVQSEDYDAVCRFRDVLEGSYYYEAVQNMVDRGLLSGMTKYTFEPNLEMTRGMLVTVLWRMAGSPAVGTASGFQDVPANRYYAEPITWAAKQGITTGVTATTFCPDAVLTREQLAAFLYRYAQTMGYNISAYNNLAKYTDTRDASSYAIPYLRWAVGAGIIQGMTETTLVPKGTATRAQAATMIYRILNYYGL